MNAKMTAVALTMALGFSTGAAHAAQSELYSNNGHTLKVGDTLTDTGSKSFSDAFNFTESFSGHITGATFTAVNGKFTSITLNAFDTSTNKYDTLVSTGLIQTNGTDVFGKVNFNANTQYQFDITGTFNGIKGSHATLVGTVSAVPEPTEGALLLSGIGLLGFIAARRSKAN